MIHNGRWRVRLKSLYISPVGVTISLLPSALRRTLSTKKGCLTYLLYPLKSYRTLSVPKYHKIFVAVTYTQLNRERTRLYTKTKENGFSFATFIHPTVFVDETAEIGHNRFIFELNSIQYNVRIGRYKSIYSDFFQSKNDSWERVKHPSQ